MQLSLPLSTQFDATDLPRWFGKRDLDRGEGYIDAVSRLQTDAHSISALVQGTAGAPYRVQIDFRSGRGGKVDIDARCTCPVGHHCKHGAATLLAALAARQAMPTAAPPAGLEAPAVRPGVFEWVEQLKAIAAVNDGPTRKRPAKRSQAIFYVLEREPRQRRWRIRLHKAPMALGGGLGRGGEEWSNFEHALLKPPSFVDDDDLAIFRLLLEQRGKPAEPLPVCGPHSIDLLRRMLDSGRLYAVREEPQGQPAGQPIRLFEGEERPGHFAWEACEHGTQATFYGEPSIDAAIPTEPPWYIDFRLRQIGRLAIDLPAALLPHLTRLPPLNTEEATVVAEVLQKLAPHIPLPRPEATSVRHVKTPLRAVFRVVHVTARPDALLVAGKRAGSELEIGLVEFHYDDVVIPQGQTGNLVRRPDGSRVLVERDERAERKLVDGLYGHEFLEAPAGVFEGFEAALGSAAGVVGEVFLPEDEELWYEFNDRVRPAMEADGWEIRLPAEFRYRTRQADEWFAEIEEGTNQWFSLSLGIVVEGRNYPLAPLVHSLLSRESEWSDKSLLAAIPDQRQVRFNLPDGTRLELPAGRLKPLVATMIDLLDAPSSAPLRVSRFDLPRVLDATAEGGWRRRGDEKAQQIANRLRGSLGVQAVESPAGFNAELRPYQKEGLAWLQYLRAHDLAGILADDMGLGKTAQALAHLLIEKHAGRLRPVADGGDGPALVVLPTSLIFNWKREAERFAPALKVLSLHGALRKERFAEIPTHDVILTTYPLLWRDAETLKAHSYHTLLLDEAQTVKNSASKAAETVRTLPAKHRLCLTGTPLENHLGELWAQFDFLLPGLLGDAREFTRTWRAPIEKRADAVRRDILARRVRPFILRRKKEDVARELPPKSVILRTVELDGAQRDLYEIVRATMDSKVRQEIASRGFARSQIIILDALLKLRQVCCDPRLLRSDSAKKVSECAKLELLMDMLPELVDEGRRVLVFSQFAGMLDLIAAELDKARLDFVRLSGETRDRETPINRFQNCEVPIFLISLKAGGVGLNLTAADTVIHYDPWWNPAAENQATDRAHRIGQTKQVFVYKLIVAGSIEEKILALQEKKAALAEGILSDDAAALGKFSESDIAALLAPLPR
jgi:superfamily II DNA or RNA helicase